MNDDQTPRGTIACPGRRRFRPATCGVVWAEGLSPMAKTRKTWVRRVMSSSDALDVPPGVFKRKAPELARALKRSALASRRRKADPYRSALSLLTFYINRAGRNLAPT